MLVEITEWTEDIDIGTYCAMLAFTSCKCTEKLAKTTMYNVVDDNYDLHIDIGCYIAKP